MSVVQPTVAIPDADILLPPCALDSDEPPLDDRHFQQIVLFLECLHWLWRDRTDFYASANSTIYFSEKQLHSRDFRGPDFFSFIKMYSKSMITSGSIPIASNLQALLSSTVSTNHCNPMLRGSFGASNYSCF